MSEITRQKRRLKLLYILRPFVVIVQVQKAC